MTITFPIIELVDRYVIAKLKFDRTNANREELDFYTKQLESVDLRLISHKLEDLRNIHSCIWDLESQLKSGRESELSLSEIGRRAILIRDHNNKRIALKNEMASILKCSVREIKKDHLSE